MTPKMRWPYEGESMHEYSEYMIDLLSAQGRVVTISDHRAVVELGEAIDGREPTEAP